MDAQKLVESLENSSGGKVAVKVGDQYFEVQTVYDNNDCVMLTLGGNFLPEEGGGTAPDTSQGTLATPATNVEGERANPLRKS